VSVIGNFFPHLARSFAVKAAATPSAAASKLPGSHDGFVAAIAQALPRGYLGNHWNALNNNESAEALSYQANEVWHNCEHYFKLRGFAISLSEGVG